ncbi:MAG: serine/threonine protein phosphatase [Cytophagaceae bacterium]|jgi:serine/threonine protein phosphatase 1|nr:serine/threonine protein phosphatase [Cytophagaceae bacterium]
MKGRTIAIGDIHGCIKTLEQLLIKVSPTPDDTLIFLGDYIDRGPNSMGVINYIIQLQEQYIVVCLRGNHEQMMLDASRDYQLFDLWVRNGGDATLRSFGVEHIKKIPQKYVEWLEQLSYYFVTENEIYVHAGINTNIPNPFSDIEAMMWIRSFEVNPKRTHNKYVIHGHTPTSMENIRKDIETVEKSSQLSIDNGCVYHKTKKDMGHLCAFISSTKSLICQQNIDF